jgi:hypothetical protein
MKHTEKIAEIKEALKNNFGVIYNPEAHTYTNAEGLELSGITRIIKEFICPNIYTEVPAEVLESARIRGTKLHALLELYANGTFANVTEEDKEVIDNFNAMALALEDYTCLASEYVVSNNDLTASPIDLLALDYEGNLVIIDLKTTSALNVEFVTWQLNFYRYFLELQTGLKTDNMQALHVSGGKAKFVKVQKIANEHLDYMLFCAYSFTEFKNPLQVEEDKITKLETIYRRKKALEEQIKALEEQEEQIKAEVIAEMKANAVKTYESESIRVTYKSASTRSTFDSKRFAEAEPDIYKNYLKTTETKESITIKLK